MARFHFTAQSDSAAFVRGSFAIVEQSRHPALRLIGERRRGRLLSIIVFEWAMCEADGDANADLGDFQAALTERVRRKVRAENWGFIWWLPLVMAAIEIIIKLLIERWTCNR